MAKLNKEEALTKINEGTGDFQVFTHEEHESFLNNLKDTEIFKEQIDGRVRDIYQRIDSDVSGITGEEKAGDEKTYDYVKRQLSQLSTTAKELEAKKAELQKAVDDKSGSEALEILRGQFDTLTKKYSAFKDEADAKYKTLEKSGVQMRIQSQFKDAMAGMKFKDAAIIPEDVRNAMIANATAELAKTAEYVDGKLVFRDDGGKIRYNDQAQILSAKEILSDKLKSIIDAGRKIDGLDVKDPEIEKDKDGKVIVNISLPDSVKTNVDLSGHLMSLGMKSGSDEYRAAYAKYSPKLKKAT
jgi:hypothetical protein